ncbi:hypothetical protein Tdes44962_MAKER01993 [Teratosphaeria destructans]|uniref:Uncharacterized protein n=1 Tax=Teratosphaeria destructans TaxID=418781 RepID=A0A9W7SW22_9PEZI|nr:hypothetical protein Tdes44962_MAKER01993 [Teratosphaeria destructans]
MTGYASVSASWLRGAVFLEFWKKDLEPERAPPIAGSEPAPGLSELGSPSPPLPSPSVGPSPPSELLPSVSLFDVAGIRRKPSGMMV